MANTTLTPDEVTWLAKLVEVFKTIPDTLHIGTTISIFKNGSYDPVYNIYTFDNKKICNICTAINSKSAIACTHCGKRIL